MLTGQGLIPKRYHALADIVPENVLISRMDELRRRFASRVAAMGSHENFVRAATEQRQTN